jgi:hypothetical protein
MNNFSKLNNIFGWLTFLIAMVVYTLTLEPTVSFWDCGEFIMAAEKLQVCHPPGAPLFLLIGRFFALFAFGDASKVPFMMNMLSALMSALTVLFTFWTITHLARKIVAKPYEELFPVQMIAIIGAGLVGALTLTFSDTFWFSAVEAEVYAASCFFTAITFWAILKWENIASEKHADRILVLIAYMVGLAIGVHLLNLLVIPAVVFVYFFRKYEPTTLRLFKAGGMSLLILIVIQFIIIPGLPLMSAKSDYFFVNTLGLPFYSGFAFFWIFLIAAFTWGIWYSIKKRKIMMNTALLCVAFVIIGYASYATLFIRSMADVPHDHQNVEDPFALVSFINREQYGDRPLGRGQYYTATQPVRIDYEDTYRKGKERYEIGEKKEIPIYDNDQMTIFPRMWSSRGDHVQAYREWEGIPEGKKPRFSQNLDFFFTYQLGFMYWRYFFWNFVGRQNDIQGHGEISNGNFLTGIDFIDRFWLGPQKGLPQVMKDNKGRNTYFALPLLLGIFGLFFHFKKDAKDAFVVTLLFLFTGILIIVYLNFPPLQPRERDYAYVGSYQTFCIWVGLGVLWLWDLLARKINRTNAAVLATAVGLLASPVLMATQNWDDHDRSNRRTALDFAKDYLNSCAPNAVLFTNGDNDTYPLWYIQNVEQYRTDVRVVNLSLLNTDWYADILKRPVYNSPPIPGSLTPDKYRQGTRDYVIYYNNPALKIDQTKSYNLKDIIDFIGNDKDPRAKFTYNARTTLSYFPTKKFFIPVDKDAVLANGTVAAKDADSIVSRVEFDIDKNGIYKNDLIVLDFIANNNWERPVYFTTTTGREAYLNMEDYFQLEGLAYRLVPVKARDRSAGEGRINTDIMYDNMMNKFVWGNMDQDVYLDGTILRQCRNFRMTMFRLAMTLSDEGKEGFLPEGA